MKRDVLEGLLPVEASTKTLMVKKRDIEHKIQMGILFDAYYDTETTDLNKRFAEISQFGGVITDLAGNILCTVDLKAKISPYTVFSPYAWLVQRMRKKDFEKGDPRSIFMGKVLKFFENASHLSSAPYAKSFLASCRKGVYKNESNEPENYYSYPVLNDDGNTDWDYIRIHENLKKFYFKDSKTGQWVKRDIRALSIGYNNINADDQWLWTAAHMAGFSNIFMTHLPQIGMYRLDALRVVEATVIAGRAGENRLKAALRVDKRTGAKTMSFSQGSILEANTRLASEMRSIKEGVTLADGSYIDLSQLHGALPDALSLLALMRYTRTYHPDIVRQMEQNTDWKHVIEKLTDAKDSFGNNPPLAYIDKAFPNIDGKMVSLIGTDQHRNAPKVAVVWNLGIDPKAYTFNGKFIADLNEFDWKEILKDSKNNLNAPLKIIRAHKSPRLLDAATGYASGFNLGLDRGEIQSRINFVRSAKITKDVMMGLRLAFPRLHGTDRIILPQPEEELFTFSTLELFDTTFGEDVQVHYRLQNKVEEIAQKSRAHIMHVKALWLKSIQFDEDIFTGQNNSTLGFMNKFSELNKELKKRGAALIPASDTDIIDKETALQYKIKVLIFARNYFAQGQIQDIGHYFWFEDSDGIRYSDSQVKEWPSHRIDDSIKAGQLRIKHEHVHTMPLIIDRMIEELGYAHILGPEILKQLDAYKAIRHSGIPHYHGQGDRWYTIDQALKDIAKLRNNEISNADITAIEGYIPGAWEIFMGKQHDLLASLSEYEAYIKGLQNREVKAENMPYLGIDPETKYPIKNFDFAVDFEKAIIIDVPERYIDNPSIDPITHRPLWVLPLHKQFNKKANEVTIEIILRAEGTGKLYHFPTAHKIVSPQRGGIYSDFYKAVRNVYDNSGVHLPDDKNTMCLIGNGPYPIFDIRSANAEAQSILVPKYFFEGMISPKLSGFEAAPYGLIIRDDVLQIELGTVRIQELDSDKPSGWEFEADVVDVKEISLEDVKKFSKRELNCFGFTTLDEAVDRFSSLFTKQKKNPKDTQNMAKSIVFGNFSPQDPRRGMMFYNPEMQVISCVQPTAYLKGPN